MMKKEISWLKLIGAVVSLTFLPAVFALALASTLLGYDPLGD